MIWKRGQTIQACSQLFRHKVPALDFLSQNVCIVLGTISALRHYIFQWSRHSPTRIQKDCFSVKNRASCPIRFGEGRPVNYWSWMVQRQSMISTFLQEIVWKKLIGDRIGQYSFRINDQWRICFKWQDGHAYQVDITDYHTWKRLLLVMPENFPQFIQVRSCLKNTSNPWVSHNID